jgi:hypothetical protein
MHNPEVESLRAALWNVYWDRKEEKIDGEEAVTLGSILHTLVELLAYEQQARQEYEEARREYEEARERRLQAEREQ